MWKTLNNKQMKKIITLLAVLTLTAPVMVAQISEGQPSSKTIRTGNRPVKGNFGLYFGFSSDIVDGWANLSGVAPLPMLNFKYMATDKLEARIGLDPFCASSGLAGKATPTDNQLKSGHDEGHLYLSPGIAYHFSTKNILDVYVGAEIPFGFRSAGNIVKYGDANNTWEKKTTVAGRIGLGAFVGLQVFVANLPLALGFEYGISANADLGGVTKTVVFDGTQKTTKYSGQTDGGAVVSDMSKLSMNKGILGNQVRLTLSYYFK